MSLKAKLIIVFLVGANWVLWSDILNTCCDNGPENLLNASTNDCVDSLQTYYLFSVRDYNGLEIRFTHRRDSLFIESSLSVDSSVSLLLDRLNLFEDSTSWYLERARLRSEVAMLQSCRSLGYVSIIDDSSCSGLIASVPDSGLIDVNICYLLDELRMNMNVNTLSQILERAGIQFVDSDGNCYGLSCLE